MSTWYRTGTIGIANGATTVTGTSTAWSSTVRAGDFLFIGTFSPVEVSSVTSNTVLELVAAWPNATQSGAAYAVAQGIAWGDVTTLAVEIANLISSQTDILSGSGVPSDSLGSDGSVYFRQDAPEYYAKTSGAWGSPISLIGLTGATGADYTTTSTTSVAIASSGSKSFTVASGKAYVVGTRVRAASSVSPSNYMEGFVTSYSGTTLVFTADNSGGSGTIASWNISLAGDKGATGATGASYSATSTTSLAIGTGSKSLTTQSGLAYVVGSRVRLASAADTANYMEGPITAYSSTSMTVNVTLTGGSGTLADWNISIAGAQGATGSQGIQGVQGVQGDAGPTYSDTSSTSNSIGTGSKTFTVSSGKPFVIGTRLRATDAADSANLMEGPVTSYSGTSLSISADYTEGSGTKTSWTISLTGARGPTGLTGSTGDTGPTGPNYNSTSATSLTVGTGSKAFTVASGLPYAVGQRLRAASAADPSIWMSGLVASYSSTTLTLTVDLIGSAGTAADWNISLTGEKGDTGPAGGFASLSTTKGTLAVGDGAQYGALAVGSDGYIAQADSTQTYGLVYRSVGAALASGTRIVTSVASAATCDIGAAATDYVNITGTTTITSLGTGANKLRRVRFAAALLLTYNGTSLILPGLVSITTAAGDEAVFASDGSGNWKCLDYIPQANSPLKVVRGDSVNSVLSASEKQVGRLNVGAAAFDAGAALGLLTNPFFEVSQENGTTAGAAASAYYPADQWYALESSGAVLSVQNVSSPFSSTATLKRLQSSIKATATTADGTISAAEYIQPCVQVIEGMFWRSLGWGTADARSVDVVIIAQCSVTGTYPVAITNAAGNRAYCATISLTANTPTVCFVTIPGDTGGTWVTTTAASAKLFIGAVGGSDYQVSSLNTWEATDNFSHSSCTNWAASGTTDFFQVAYTQIFPAGVLPFTSAAQITGEALQLLLNMKRPYEVEHERCRRYYERIPPCRVVGTAFGTVELLLSVPFVVRKRAAPAMSVLSSPGSNFHDGTNTLGGTTSIAASVTHVDGAYLQVNGITGTSGSRAVVGLQGSTEVFAANARL